MERNQNHRANGHHLGHHRIFNRVNGHHLGHHRVHGHLLWLIHCLNGHGHHHVLHRVHGHHQ